MQDRVFTAEQLVPVRRAAVFAFFSDPRNLEAITPPWLHFRIVGRTTEDVRDNSEFTYRLKLRGIPLKWVSRISEWVPGERFVDEQIRGSSIAVATDKANEQHYERTLLAWLRRLDDRRDEAMEILGAHYGADQARLWFVPWRLFLLACAELFGYREGREWLVGHYLFEPVRSS